MSTEPTVSLPRSHRARRRKEMASAIEYGRKGLHDGNRSINRCRCVGAAVHNQHVCLRAALVKKDYDDRGESL